MEEIVNLFHGFAVALQPFNIMVMLVGIVLGVIIGVLPGLGGANGVAILLPLTFSMPPTSAIIMLSCIYWGAEGPRAGFFPFYIGMFIVVASAINLWHALRDGDEGLLAEWGQLRQVMSVVVPTAIYVGAMPFTGLYVASIIFIGWFMRWLGKYSWLTVIAVSFGMPILTYFIFERLFLVPLPKGPIEEWLGL